MADEVKMTKVVSKCAKCGEMDEFFVPRSGLDKLSKGIKLRDAFPSLDESRIQQLATHFCPGCQEAMRG